MSCFMLIKCQCLIDKVFKSYTRECVSIGPKNHCRQTYHQFLNQRGKQIKTQVLAPAGLYVSEQMILISVYLYTLI